MELLQTNTQRDVQRYILEDHGETRTSLPRHRNQPGAMLDPDLMTEHINLFRTAMPKIEESNKRNVKLAQFF